MRSTFYDISQRAGVSSATVDRVLNNRPGVRQRTRDLVLRTARELGYIDDLAAETSTEINIDFVLPAGTNSFMEELRQQLASQSKATPNVSATIHSISGFDPITLADTLRELEGQSQGVGIVGLDHPAVRESIRALTQSGVPAVTLLSDIHHVPRAGYVGVDNRSAGRLAGYITGRMLGRGDHKVALFAGSLSYRGHEEREMGYRNILLEEFSNLQILDLTEIRDDTERAYNAAKAHLEAHPDIAAIYNIGAGNRGIARALEEVGKAKSIFFVGHELTAQTKMLLLNGTMDLAIDQNARVQAREAIAQLCRIARGENWNMHPLRIAAVFKENIPEE